MFKHTHIHIERTQKTAKLPNFIERKIPSSHSQFVLLLLINVSSEKPQAPPKKQKKKKQKGKIQHAALKLETQFYIQEN